MKVNLSDFKIEYNADRSIITNITATRSSGFPPNQKTETIKIYETLLNNASKLVKKIGGRYQFEDLIEDIVSKLHEDGIKEEQIKRLIGDFTNKVNEIYLIKKMALSLGLSGKFKIDEQNEIDLEGSDPTQIYKHFIDLKALPDSMKPSFGLAAEILEKVKDSSNVSTIGTKIREFSRNNVDFKGPIVISRKNHKKAQEHVSSFIISGDLLLVCDRSDNPSGIDCYKLPQDFDKDELYKKIINPKNEDENKQLISEINGIHICTIPSKKQKVGNCAYANTRLAIKGLLVLEQLEKDKPKDGNKAENQNLLIDKYSKENILKAAKGIDQEYEKIVTIDRKYNIEEFVKNFTDANGKFISDSVKAHFFEISCRYFAQQSWPVRTKYLEVGSFLYKKLTSTEVGYQEEYIIKKVKELQKETYVKKVKDDKFEIYYSKHSQSMFSFWAGIKYLFYKFKYIFKNEQDLLNEAKNHQKKYALPQDTKFTKYKELIDSKIEETLQKKKEAEDKKKKDKNKNKLQISESRSSDSLVGSGGDSPKSTDSPESERKEKGIISSLVQKVLGENDKSKANLKDSDSSSVGSEGDSPQSTSSPKKDRKEKRKEKGIISSLVQKVLGENDKSKDSNDEIVTDDFQQQKIRNRRNKKDIKRGK